MGMFGVQRFYPAAAIALLFVLLPAPALSDSGRREQAGQKRLTVLNNPAASAVVDFLAREKGGPKIRLEDVTPKFSRVDKSETEFLKSVQSYDQLKSYFNDNARDMMRVFPDVPLVADFKSVFSSYSGKPRFSFPEVHMYPIFPVSFMVHDDKKIVLSKMTVDYQEKKLYGLKVNCRMAPQYGRSIVALVTDMAYMPTVNARALGFGYAQLILPLSDNIRPAQKFEYNGLHDWSEHTRSRDDQVTAPLDLTNFAHTINNGGDYVVSPLPDFALEVRNPTKREGRLFFFLWRRNTNAAAAEPDFLFEAEISPPLRQE